ncbi:MAG: hypothetical protein Q7T18_08935, partial [Sedimentisphaerales bacterium]|nr:hypothetical protein [Sedimentisphaerales bacterium]
MAISNCSPANNVYKTVGTIHLEFTTASTPGWHYLKIDSDTTFLFPIAVEDFYVGTVNPTVCAFDWTCSTPGTYYWKPESPQGYAGPFTLNVVAVAPKATTPGPGNNATQIPLNQQLTFV